MDYVTYGSYEKDERVRYKVSLQIAKPKNPGGQSQPEKKEKRCLFSNTYDAYKLEHTKNTPNLQISFDILFPKLLILYLPLLLLTSSVFRSTYRQDGLS